MKNLLKNYIRSNYALLGYAICCVAICSCVREKLYCNQESMIECKEDLRLKRRSEKYIVLILSYDSKFKLEDLDFYKDSALITDKIVEGEYDNPNNPKRIEIQMKKSEVGKITVLFSGTCYKLTLKKSFDNYIIDYDIKESKFSAIANNQEFLTIE